MELSGDRFLAHYLIQGDEALARRRAEEITIEQTVEFPPDLVEVAAIRENIFGRIEAFEPVDGAYRATVSYAVETAGNELTQLLNVLFGNTSLKPGICLQGFEPTPSLLEGFRGPRFGQAGLRAHLGVYGRPLLCTAVKPMGLGSDELARLAGAFARGGIDLIKDDHGLADQPFCRFADRVVACAQAVASANAATGAQCLYLPNVTASPLKAIERARLAKEAGAGGLLVSPGLCGWDTMRTLAEDSSLGLPVLCHPALLGSFHADPRHGVGHGLLYGQLARLAGADATIFPSYGGRFSFTEEQCRDLVHGATAPLGPLAPLFPIPAGGMTLDRVPELLDFYGKDVMLLVGGDLHRHGADRIEGSRAFVAAVEKACAALEVG